MFYSESKTIMQKQPKERMKIVQGVWQTAVETSLLVYRGRVPSQLENFDRFNLLYPALLLSVSSAFIKAREPVLIFLFSAQDKKTES